jgi:hypothetical protein
MRLTANSTYRTHALFAAGLGTVVGGVEGICAAIRAVLLSLQQYQLATVESTRYISGSPCAIVRENTNFQRADRSAHRTKAKAGGGDIFVEAHHPALLPSGIAGLYYTTRCGSASRTARQRQRRPETKGQLPRLGILRGNLRSPRRSPERSPRHQSVRPDVVQLAQVLSPRQQHNLLRMRNLLRKRSFVFLSPRIYVLLSWDVRSP